MKKVNTLIVPLVLLLLSACGPSGIPDTQSGSAASAQPNEGRAVNTEPQSTGPRIWPQLAEGEVVTQSDNALAVNYYVVIDQSGSMDSKDRDCTGDRRLIDVAKEAAVGFVDGLDPEINLGLLVFGGTQELIPLGVSNHDAFKQAVMAINAVHGTPMRSAIYKAYQALEAKAKSQGGGGKFRMIILTDGHSGDGDPASLVKDIVQKSSIEMYAIGFCLEDHALNMPGFTRYFPANSPEALFAALSESAETEDEDFDVDDFEE